MEPFMWELQASGIAYIDSEMTLHNMEDSQLENAYIIRLASDKNGLVYGNTRSGGAFILENGRVTAYYNGENLGIGAISNIFPDPNNEGYIYLATDEEKIYYGSIDNDLKGLQSISVPGANSISVIDYACNRIWVISDGLIGYLNAGNHYIVVENVPLNSKIVAMTEDYQGNLWFASTRQGVMKLVSNNYFDMTEAAGLSAEVVNATCKTGSYLYVGTDKGLQIINCNNNQSVDGKIIDYIGNARIRAIAKDNDENVWIGTYTNGLGLIEYTPDKEIIVYNEDNGFISNGIRAIRIAEDGSVLVATNDGMAVFKDDKLVKVIDENIGISNKVFLTLEEGDNDKYYIGTLMIQRW